MIFMPENISLKDLKEAIKDLEDLKLSIEKDLTSKDSRRTVDFFLTFRGIKLVAKFDGYFKDVTLDEANKLGFIIDNENRTFSFEATNSNLSKMITILKEKYENLKIILRDLAKVPT
jgi:hypothetical protein